LGEANRAILVDRVAADQGKSSTMGTTSARPRASRDPKQVTAWVIVVLAAAWLIAFIVSNSQDVRVSFVFGHVTLSLIWVMVICAVIGGLLAILVPRLRRRR
jgi:uncharacterized integral membrane protein